MVANSSAFMTLAVSGPQDAPMAVLYMFERTVTCRRFQSIPPQSSEQEWSSKCQQFRPAVLLLRQLSIILSVIMYTFRYYCYFQSQEYESILQTPNRYGIGRAPDYVIKSKLWESLLSERTLSLVRKERLRYTQLLHRWDTALEYAWL